MDTPAPFRSIILPPFNATVKPSQSKSTLIQTDRQLGNKGLLYDNFAFVWNIEA